MVNDQVSLSNNEEVNKNSCKETEVIIDLSDGNQMDTLSNVADDYNYDIHIQTVNNEVTATTTSTTPVKISEKKGVRCKATWK